MSHSSNLPMLLRSLDSSAILRVNRSFEDLLGLDAGELSTRSLLDWIHPEDQGVFTKVLSAGEGRVRARHGTRQQGWEQFDWTFRVAEEGVVALGLLHQEGAPTGLYAGAGGAPSHSTLTETLESMVQVIELKNPGHRCSVLLVDGDRRRITVAAGPSFPAAYNEAVEGLLIGPAVGSCGSAAFWNVPVIVEDIATDPLWEGLREAAALADVKACWSHPVTATNGDVLGAMAIYSNEPSAPSSNQMDGLEIAAKMVGCAVERGLLDEKLRQAAKLEALGVLAGGIAHDLNNMLAAVMGNAELALAMLDGDDLLRQKLKEIVTASMGATELCDQMLAYAGGGSLSKEPVDCNGLIRELGGLLSVGLSKKSLLVYELSRDGLGVLADRGQLRQVIMNLITNASEALNDQEGRIVLSTSSRHFDSEELALRSPHAGLPPGEFVCIRVGDTGEGLDDDTKARIFDPFFTTKAAGRGLGLAAVQGIVLGHGGSIWLESEPGHGTTFEILLPRISEAVPEDPASPDPKSDTVSAHLLVVDDDPQVLAVFVQMLELAGYSVSCASDGQEAIDLFRSAPTTIDGVLLDLNMPRLNGHEVFLRLRTMEPDLPVVLTSGFAEGDVIERFAGEGYAGFVHKPTKMRVLLDAVVAALTPTLQG